MKIDQLLDELMSEAAAYEMSCSPEETSSIDKRVQELRQRIIAALSWLPIETAPYDRTVLLKGDSGMREPRDTFIINGYRVADWHGGNWNDVQGTPLADNGWRPTHWREVP